MTVWECKMLLPIKMTLPGGFLDEEVRCGYTVTPKLKKVWAVELDLLNELLRVCKKHNIRVQVSYGTLLGAVRHKGFIPWDDDLDVWLPRDEYNKLLSVARTEFQEPYFFQTALSDKKFYFPYARLRNSKTTAVIAGQGSPEYNNGIYIDIYVIDGFVESRLLFYFQLILRRITTKCLTLHSEGNKGKKHGWFLHLLFFIACPIVRLIPFDSWFYLNTKVTALYNRYAKRFSVVYEMMTRPYTHWITKAEWNDVIEIPFECLQVPVPRSYAEVLTRMYGDYNTYPPVAERGVWHEGQIRFEPDIPYKEFLGQKK